MGVKENPISNSIAPQPATETTRIGLIDHQPQYTSLLQENLTAEGYQIELFSSIDEALFTLTQTDLLLLDIKTARRPKSSKLIKARTILVLTDNQNDELPPWLEARHIFLIHRPPDPAQLVERLPDYLSTRPPAFDLATHNPEHLALLFGITQFLSGHLNINDLFERILALAPYLEGQFAALLVQEGDEIIYYRSTQPGREELTGPAGRRFAQRLLAEGLEGWALRHNQAVLIPNTGQDSRWLRASYLPDIEHCTVALPLRLERVDAQGVYLIGHRQPGFFSQTDMPLLEAALTQIGLSIENALLFKNQAQRSMQLALINEVSQIATSILNLDVMLRTVAQVIRRSLGCYSVAIYLYNPAAKRAELRSQAISERHRQGIEEQPPLSRKPQQGLIGWSLAAKQTVLVNDVARDPRHIPSSHHHETRSELCVPITLGVKIIGVLDLQSLQLEAFNTYHVAALETLTDQLAIAIENARLYDEINQRVEELKSLNELGQAVTSTLDLKKTLTLVTDHTTRLMEVAAASVVLRDDQNNQVWFAAASGEGSEAAIGIRMELGQGIAGWVASHGEPVIVPDVYEDERFFAEVDKQSGFTTRSILCVPLQTKGRTIGALEVMNKRRGTFDLEDLAMLQALAIPAATAIENAQLYEEQTNTIERLAETQTQLIQSAKLAAVGELAAGIAHEINNPLTTIIALTSLLVESNPLAEIDQEAQVDLQMVNEEACRARDIVRNLLNFARAEPPRRQPTDFNELIEQCIFLVYTKKVSHKIRLEKTLGELPEMFLDTNQIKQVLVNLLNNAVQAMTKNEESPATLSIKTEFQATARARSGKPQAVVLCHISDTGHGIAPEHLNKIFDPFFTTKEVGQGTGLGLSISYGIIEKHGGKIEVETTPGEGSTFTLILPATTPAEAAQTTVPAELSIIA